ncbi:MAG: hypothetical protein VYC39_19210 [Myxococcota bacterium]|nr:hypothetical protein [Myxococcota bacterium]
MSDGTLQASFEELNRRFRIEKVVQTTANIKILEAYRENEKVLIHIPSDAAIAAKIIRTIRGLQHPGVLRFIEEIQTAHNQIFVTEYFEINPLGPLLLSGNYRHNELFTVRLVQQAAHVLTYLHGLRPPIIHGACTLENFHLGSSGRLVLTNFERAHDDPRRAFETLDDIRRLAIGAIQLLTKLPPDEIAILMVEDLLKMSISRPLATLLIEALSPDPHTRPSAAQFGLRLQDLLLPLERDSKTVTFTQRPTSRLETEEEREQNTADGTEDALELDFPEPNSGHSEASIIPRTDETPIPLSDTAMSTPDAYQSDDRRPPKTRQNRLQELWQAMLAAPEDQDLHQKFSKFSVESNQYKEAAEMYRNFEREFPQHSAISEKFREEIAMKAAARIMASQPKVSPAPQAVAGFAKWSLAASSAGLVISIMIQSLLLAVLSGPVFAFSIWARFRRNK